MEATVKLINERLLSNLGAVTRTEESIGNSREHMREMLRFRDTAVDEAVEFIAFLDLYDKEWRDRLEEDQKRMLLRVESLKLVDGTRHVEKIEPEYESLGFARTSVLKRAWAGGRRQSLPVRILSPEEYERRMDDIDDDDIDRHTDYVEMFVKKGALL